MYVVHTYAHTSVYTVYVCMCVCMYVCICVQELNVCMHVQMDGYHTYVCVHTYTTLLTLQVHIWIGIILYIDYKFQLICANGDASQPHSLPRLLCCC